MRDGTRDTYWKEGALLLGIPAAVATFLFVNGSNGETGNAVLDGLVLGAVGAAVGGLVGWFFAKKGAEAAEMARQPTASQEPRERSLAGAPGARLRGSADDP